HVDRDRRADDRLEHAVAEIAGAEPVAVRDERGPARERGAEGPVVEFDAHLLAQEPATPSVVVAAREGDRHTRFDQLGERGEDAEMLARNDCRVLEPEIEEVARDQEGARVGRDTLEETQEATLGCARHAAQVQVADDQVGFHHDRAKLRARSGPASARRRLPRRRPALYVTGSFITRAARGAWPDRI